MIDKNVSPGRYLFTESVNHNELVGRHYKIVRVSGQRIVVTEDGSTKERFVYKPLICCDTEDEVRKIQRLSDNFASALEDLREEFSARWKTVTGLNMEASS